MIRVISVCILILTGCFSWSQSIDKDLLEIKERLDVVNQFTADLEMTVDISFINMPQKHAEITYERGEDLKVNSEDFVLIPKRGLDLPLNEIFKYDFITVDRGMEERNGANYKMINIIPTDDRADFSIATLLLDTINKRISESRINTKKDGAYTVKMAYAKKDDVLPSDVEVDFEVERMRLPLRYMGKEADVDKEKYRSKEVKTGKIYLKINNYKVDFKSSS